MQRALGVLYPAQCLVCEERIVTNGAFCGACRGGLADITGTICDCCGTPLIGPQTCQRELCDECMTNPPPWKSGRAVWTYGGTARRLVMLLKHNDRTDLARPAAEHLLRSSDGLITPDSLLAPVPLHWTRLFRRRYNQSALLTKALARLTGCDHVPDLLKRVRRTAALQSHSFDARQAELLDAITVTPRRADLVKDRRIVVVDDVMTSGATMRACSDALIRAGALRVDVLVLARVVKD